MQQTREPETLGSPTAAGFAIGGFLALAIWYEWLLTWIVGMLG